jgi:CheY-like chemotaxis protein
VELDSLDPVKLKFSVNDTGIGIKTEDQDKLFKLFGRLEHEDKRINTSGVGLGLTISNTLVLLLSIQDGPGIQLQSEENKGSSFSFLIYDKVKEASGSKERTDKSLGNVSSGSAEENPDTTIMNKMSTYTLNYLENHTKNINNSQNLESKFATSPETLTRRLPRNPADYASFPSINSEDSVLMKRPRSKKMTTYLDIIKDIGPSEVDHSPSNQIVSRRDQPWCLIVDDNPFNLIVASHLMEENDYQLKTAINGKDAIQKVLEHEQTDHPAFRVILMDCQMPVMDGYEATRILRMMMNGKEIKDCPILALTANNCDEDHEKLCQEVGMSGSLTKPLQPKELEKMLKKLNQSLG